MGQVSNSEWDRADRLRRSAETGDLDAMYRLGYWLSEHGEQGKAEEWLNRSAAGGHTKAMDALGYVYERAGRLELAEDYYRNAAELGLNESKSHLAYVLGLQGDDVGAESWYRAAADSGDVIAMINLGRRCAHRGDLERAKDFFSEAIQRGHEAAMIELGRIWRDGGDIESARRLFERALEKGVSGASEELTELDQKLISDPYLEALSFDTFGWEMSQNRENLRRWQSPEGLLDERFVDGPPFFDTWDLRKIRMQVSDLLGDVDGGDVSVDEPAWRREGQLQLPDRASLIDLSLGKKRFAKLVTLVVRSVSRSQVHYTATVYILYADAWWTIQIDVQEEEPVGDREAAVLREILGGQSESSIALSQFQPYDKRWDGLLPIEMDPLSKVRLLSKRLVGSLELSGVALELKPFDGLE